MQLFKVVSTVCRDFASVAVAFNLGYASESSRIHFVNISCRLHLQGYGFNWSKLWLLVDFKVLPSCRMFNKPHRWVWRVFRIESPCSTGVWPRTKLAWLCRWTRERISKSAGKWSYFNQHRCTCCVSWIQWWTQKGNSHIYSSYIRWKMMLIEDINITESLEDAGGHLNGWDLRRLSDWQGLLSWVL